MAVNKVVYGTTVLVDLTEDTVSPDKLAKGITAHDKTGASIVGTMESGGDTGDWHIWERCEIIEIMDYELNWEAQASFSGQTSWMGDNYKRKLFKTLIFNDQTGEITLSDPQAAGQTGTSTQYTQYANYPYYYGDLNDGTTDKTIYKITNMTRSGSIVSYTYTWETDKAVVAGTGTPRPGMGDKIENVASLEQNAYPEDGEQGEYWYKKV